MDDAEAMTRWRSLVARRDGQDLVVALSHEPWPENALQLIGDALLAAVRDGVEGAAQVAARCVAALRERHWDGDEELADALEAALGSGPAPMLRPLPVDLEELAMILEGDPLHGGGGVDLSTGEVWARPALEYAAEVGEIDEDEDEDDEDDEDERWLWVECQGSRGGYRDMVEFIDRLDDPVLADRLTHAIGGRGAFRRFKGVLSERPELLTRWYDFSNERQRGRARRWLAAEGYTPTRVT